MSPTRAADPDVLGSLVGVTLIAAAAALIMDTPARVEVARYSVPTCSEEDSATICVANIHEHLLDDLHEAFALPLGLTSELHDVEVFAANNVILSLIHI